MEESQRCPSRHPTPEERCTWLLQPKYTLGLKATLLTLCLDHTRPQLRPTIRWATSFVKVSRIQTSLFLTQKEGPVCLRLGTPWCNLAEHPSNSLRCWVRAKLEMHLPSTSCADYMKHMFLIHLHITHPGSVARAMWWPKEPNESFIIFFKQAPLRWLSFRAKKLHSFSPMTSKLDSLNLRASSDLGSETICFDPQGWLRNVHAGTRLRGEWKS